jgi:hypothetical protein
MNEYKQKFQQQNLNKNYECIGNSNERTASLCSFSSSISNDPLSMTSYSNNLDDDDGSSIHGCVQFQLLIYNTSRNKSDKRPFGLFDSGIADTGDSFTGSFSDEVSLNEELTHTSGDVSSGRPSTVIGSGGGLSNDDDYRPMKLSRLYHHPSSSFSTAIVASVCFLSISTMGTLFHRWSYVNYATKSREQGFHARLYGTCGIIILSIVVVLVIDILYRVFKFISSLLLFKNGYSTVTEATENYNELLLAEEADAGGDQANNCILEKSTNESFELKYMIPGKAHKNVIDVIQTNNQKRIILEIEFSNGRPILFDDNDNTANEDIIENQSITATMKNLIQAKSPGVFYCGQSGLFDAIKCGVNIHRQIYCQRMEDSADIDNDNCIVNDCAFYEESFEM